LASWQEIVAHFAADVEGHFDLLKYRLGERLGSRDPVMILPYHGCGSPERLYLKGRVLEDEGITPAGADDDFWDNLLNMYRRFESDEIPYARLLARFQGIEQQVLADEEGYFEAWLEPSGPLSNDLWQPVELELLEPRRKDQHPVRAVGQVLVPPAGARFGVISDIDDTVVQTDSIHLLHMARTVFLGNARTRLPFKGVGAFYRALLKGQTGEQLNPLFYVSSSPWNLYDLLVDFFNLNDIPLGPVLFLRDWGISEEEVLPIHHRLHKLQVIDLLMNLYPALSFILVGDNGQTDPEIYSEVVLRYPGRVLAVYIRDIRCSPKRRQEIQALAEGVAAAGSSLILAEDTLPMAIHASRQGWIAPQALDSIRFGKETDEAPPGPVEQLLAEGG
jgi:phosphatidate phosphatase APP1